MAVGMIDGTSAFGRKQTIEVHGVHDQLPHNSASQPTAFGGG